MNARDAGEFADSGLCYIASNSFKQEAQLLDDYPVPSSAYCDHQHHKSHGTFIPTINASDAIMYPHHPHHNRADFLGSNQAHDPSCDHKYPPHHHAHRGHEEDRCLAIDSSLGRIMCDAAVHHEHHDSLSDPSSISASADQDYKYHHHDRSSADGNCSDSAGKESYLSFIDASHADYDGCGYMDSPNKLDALINSRFTPPHAFLSDQTESSTSPPLSRILTTTANAHPGSQCKLSIRIPTHRKKELRTILPSSLVVFQIISELWLCFK
jgi:hypothetical protein